MKENDPMNNIGAIIAELKTIEIAAASAANTLDHINNKSVVAPSGIAKNVLAMFERSASKLVSDDYRISRSN